jgi:hypothetical protein
MAVFEINAETGRVVSVTLPDELLNPFIKVESKKKKSKAQFKVKSFPHYKKTKKYSLHKRLALRSNTTMTFWSKQRRNVV